MLRLGLILQVQTAYAAGLIPIEEALALVEELHSATEEEIFIRSGIKFQCSEQEKI